MPPMKTAQKMSYDLYGRTKAALANDTGGPLWGHRPYRSTHSDVPGPAAPGLGGAGVAVGAGAGAYA